MPDERNVTTYSEAMRASVLAALLLGQPSSQIAARFGIPQGTVERWEHDYAVTSPVVRRERLSEMLLVLVEQQISSLVATNIATSDEDWVKSQTAQGLAQLLDIKHDKLMAILQAFGRASAGAQIERERDARGELED